MSQGTGTIQGTVTEPGTGTIQGTVTEPGTVTAIVPGTRIGTGPE